MKPPLVTYILICVEQEIKLVAIRIRNKITQIRHIVPKITWITITRSHMRGLRRSDINADEYESKSQFYLTYHLHLSTRKPIETTDYIIRYKFVNVG